MTISTQERAASAHERKWLEDLLKQFPSRAGRWRRAAGQGTVLWAASLLLFVIAWMIVAWLAKLAFSIEIGLYSPVAFWVLAIAIPGCGLFAIVSTMRWLRGWPDSAPLLTEDIERGRVIEEHYRFTDAKRFQEQEHGGLIYFLRTEEDRVFVLYDRESQDLGAGGEDPLGSTFQPRDSLLIVRAPRCGFVIDQTFSGDAIEPGVPHDLLVPPDLWPESESYCDIPWNDLELRLSSR